MNATRARHMKLSPFQDVDSTIKNRISLKFGTNPPNSSAPPLLNRRTDQYKPRTMDEGLSKIRIRFPHSNLHTALSHLSASHHTNNKSTTILHRPMGLRSIAAFHSEQRMTTPKKKTFEAFQSIYFLFLILFRTGELYVIRTSKKPPVPVRGCFFFNS